MFQFESMSSFCVCFEDFLNPFPWDVLKRVPGIRCGHPYGCVSVRVCGRMGVLVTGTRLFVKRASSMLPVSRRFKSAAGRQTPRIH